MNETINQSIAQIPVFLGHSIPITSSAVIDIYIITLFTSLFITLINKYFSDQKKIKASRKELKKLQKKMREVLKTDPKKAQIMQQEIMKKNFENMKFAFNPKIMLMTMIPLTYVFFTIKHLYAHLGEFFNFFGFTSFSWLGTYILFSIINSIILKKVLDVA